VYSTSSPSPSKDTVLTYHIFVKPKKDIRSKPLTEGGDVIKTTKDLVELTIVLCICSDRRRAISRSRGKRGGEISISKITKYILRDDALHRCYVETCRMNKHKKRKGDCLSNALFIVRAQVLSLLNNEKETPASKILKLLALKGYLTPEEKQRLCEYAVKEYSKATEATATNVNEEHSTPHES